MTITEYDGFQSPFPTRFFLAQLAPDDQIYINSSNSVNTLHVIREPLSSIEISIYPNPSRDYFFISSEDQFPNQSQIIVYNLLGQQQLIKAVNPTQTRQLINISHLPKGRYIIQLVVDGHILGGEKMLKQ